MNERLTAKGVKQTLSGDMLKDLAEFWRSRQDKHEISMSFEYRATGDKAQKLYEIINKCLADDLLRKQLFDYDVAKNELETISSDVAYKNGFSDGIKSLLQILIL